jgi:hypothetical protein
MRSALQDLALDRLTVIYPGDRRMQLAERIEAIGLASLPDVLADIAG